MRKLVAAVFGLLLCLLVSPILLAQEEIKPVILLYHGQSSSQDLRIYGEALASIIEEDDRIAGKAEIVLVGSQDLMNTLLYFPQVKLAVIALTTWELEASRMVPSTLWYFNEGGAVVGLGNAGNEQVTGVLNGSVFPVFGNQYQLVDPIFYCTNKETGEKRMIPPGEAPRCESYETRSTERVTLYEKVTDHAITDGVGDEFSIASSRFVIHKNISATPPAYLHLEPETGSYTMVYAEANTNAPLVVVYEENGTSITFSGTDQMSVKEEDPTYFGTWTEDANFKKLFQNAVYYAWEKETKHETAMETAEQEFQNMKDEREELKQKVEESQKKERNAKLIRAVLLIVVGVVLIVAIAYWAFVIPAREGGEEQPPAPAEES